MPPLEGIPTRFVTPDGTGGAGEAGRPRLATRFVLATLFALLAAAISWRAQYVAHGNGSDHVIIQRAAQAVLAGRDPYQLGPHDQLPELFWRFFYPLPSIVLGLPFVWMDPREAAIAFTFCSAWLLVFFVTRDGLERVPMFLSVSFLAAAQFAQSTPLILALALVPGLRALTFLKPNLGIALFAWRPAWRTAAIAAGIFAVPVLFWPDWPRRWLISVHSSPAHHAPALTGIGAVALLAILRWRRPEGRLLLAMTVIPHGLFFYDELPLWLVTASRRQALVLAFCSWLGWLMWNVTSPGPATADSAVWSVASLYVPAAIILLRRPNEGTVPAWLEGLVAPLPAWIRGLPPNEPAAAAHQADVRSAVV